MVELTRSGAWRAEPQAVWHLNQSGNDENCIKASHAMHPRWSRISNVFVYGTLRAGEINDIRAVASKYDMPAPALIGTATLVGRLYDFGAYPGLVIDSKGAAVAGEVYKIDNALVPVLDEIEKVYPGVEGLFCGCETTVVVGGIAVLCRFYPVSKDVVTGVAEIPSGDWVAYRRTR